MKKILLWHQGALGDLVLSLPAVHAIKRHYEKAFLHMVCRGDMTDVIKENNIAEEVTSNERGMFSCLFAGPGGSRRDLDVLLDGFDAAFVFMRRPSELFLENIRRRIPQCNYIRTFTPPGIRMHVPCYQLRQLAGAGIESGGIFPVLEAGRGVSGPEIPPLVVIHPGSGGRKKCWPLYKYLKLMEELYHICEVSPVVLLGPAEENGEYGRLREYMSERGISAEIMRNMPVPGIVRVLRKANLFIGNDSGITHLASALGTPVVAIFGPTDHEIWKPVGDDVRIVRSGRSCSPCGEEAFRKCGGVECLETLSVESVLEEARRLISL